MSLRVGLSGRSRVRDGADFDLLRVVAQQLILRWISSGCIAGVGAAPPCPSSTFSRRGPCGSSWAPVRSSECLEGLPNLHAAALAKLHPSSCRWLSPHPCTLGSLLPSRTRSPANLGSWGPLQSYLGATSSVSLNVDFCLLGVRWRTRTRVWTWNTIKCTQYF